MEHTSDKFSFEQLVDVFNSGKDANSDRVEPVCVVVLVDRQASRELIETVKGALLPEQSNAEVLVRSLDDLLPSQPAQADICVVIGGGSDGRVRAGIERFARATVPVGVVAESLLDAPVPTLPAHLERLVTTLVSVDHDEALVKMARWIISLNKKSMAFAANFPFCRKELVRRLVQACAVQNAAISAMGVIPGSDMPILTVSQAKLALDISAAYGRPLSPARVREVLGVVGAGFGYRGVARSLLYLLPFAGLPIKAGVSYAGTVATGRAVEALLAYEDGGGDPLADARAFAAGASQKASALAGVRDSLSRVRTSLTNLVGRSRHDQSQGEIVPFDGAE